MAAPKRNREEYNAYMRDYMLRRYHRRRAKAIREMGGECVDCGGTEDLTFDHVDHTTKSFDVAKRLVSASWDVLKPELAKCVLRCERCHTIKTVEVDMDYTLRAPHLIAHRDSVDRPEQLNLFAA